MSCVIKEISDNDYDPDLLERQLGLALIKEHDGDPQKLLVTVLDFLKRKSNFFKHGDPKKRLLDAYCTVAGEAEPAGVKAGFFGRAGVTTSAAPAAAAAAPAAAHTASEVSSAYTSKASSHTNLLPASATYHCKSMCRLSQLSPCARSQEAHPHTDDAAAAGPSEEQPHAPEAAEATVPETAGVDAASFSGPPSPDVVPKAAEADEEGKPDQSKGISEQRVLGCVAEVMCPLRLVAVILLYAYWW